GKDLLHLAAGALPALGPAAKWFIQLTPFMAALLAAVLMVASRCAAFETARKSIDWEGLLAIAASCPLATALEKTGAAKSIADSTTALAGGNPWIALAIIYLITLVVTELITNNAAPLLMLPLLLPT